MKVGNFTKRLAYGRSHELLHVSPHLLARRVMSVGISQRERPVDSRDSSGAARSGLRSLIASSGKRQQVVSPPTSDSTEAEGQQQQQSSSEGRSSRTSSTSASILSHPCQLQGHAVCEALGSHAGLGRQSCALAHYPSICCLRSVGGRERCERASHGSCAWYHGAPSHLHRRLIEALWFSVEDLEDESLRVALVRNADAAGRALYSIVKLVSSAVTNVEGCVDTASGLIRHLSSSPSIPSAVQVREASSRGNGAGGTLVFKTSFLETAIGQELGHTEWLWGPVVASVLAPEGDGGEYVTLNPFMVPWLLQALRDEMTLSPSSLSLSRILTSAVVFVLSHRTRQCEEVREETSLLHHSMLLIRELMVWSCLEVHETQQTLCGECVEGLDEGEVVRWLSDVPSDDGVAASTAPLATRFLMSGGILPSISNSKDHHHLSLLRSQVVSAINESSWRLHHVLLVAYRGVVAGLQEGKGYRQLAVFPRLAFLVQPALLALGKQHSDLLEARYLNELRSVLNWKEWSDAQLSNAQSEIMYTPSYFARHYRPWIGLSCYHSVINALLLFTVRHVDAVAQLSQLSDVAPLVLNPSPSRPPQQNSNQSGGGDGGATSHRSRATWLREYNRVISAFLSALQDVGMSSQEQRQHWNSVLASRRRQYNDLHSGGIGSVGHTDRTRLYREKEMSAHRRLQREQQEAIQSPLFDCLLPHGSAVVSAESTQYLLRQFLEGGAPYKALRLAAAVVQGMRALRRASRLPMPEVVMTTKVVHRRVQQQGRKGKGKHHLAAIRVTTPRLVGGCHPSVTEAAQAFPLSYGLNERVVEEVVRVSLRMGKNGFRLAEGLLREAVAGDVIDFTGSGSRSGREFSSHSLPFPTLREVQWYLKCREEVGMASALPSILPQVLSLMGSDDTSRVIDNGSCGSPEESRAVPVGVRLVPTAGLMACALVHSTPREEESEGSALQLHTQVFSLMLLDPSRFLTPEAVVAVQMVRAMQNLRDVLIGCAYAVEASLQRCLQSAGPHFLTWMSELLMEVSEALAVVGAAPLEDRLHAVEKGGVAFSTTASLHSVKEILSGGSGPSPSTVTGTTHHEKPERTRSDQELYMRMLQHVVVKGGHSHGKAGQAMWSLLVAAQRSTSTSLLSRDRTGAVVGPLLWKWTLLSSVLLGDGVLSWNKDRRPFTATTAAVAPAIVIERLSPLQRRGVEGACQALLLSGILHKTPKAGVPLPLSSFSTPWLPNDSLIHYFHLIIAVWLRMTAAAAGDSGKDHLLSCWQEHIGFYLNEHRSQCQGWQVSSVQGEFSHFISSLQQFLRVDERDEVKTERWRLTLQSLLPSSAASLHPLLPVWLIYGIMYPSVHHITWIRDHQHHGEPSASSVSHSHHILRLWTAFCRRISSPNAGSVKQ